MKADTRRVVDAHRGTAYERGYNAKWSELSWRMRSRFPVSAGYLTRTEFWTPNLAQQFHTLRDAAAAAGQYSVFFAGVPASMSTPGFHGAGLRFLDQFPIYTFHASERREPSEVTDHIIPHRGDSTLFWAEWNLNPMSKRQHDTKTATEDGGFRGAAPAQR